MTKVVISAALTGVLSTRNQCPAIPYTPREIGEEAKRAADAGAAIVDVRPGRDYDRGHIPGSYSVGLGGPWSAWVGWLVPRGRPIILAGGTDVQHREAQRQLYRIGFDTVPPASRAKQPE